MADKRPNSSNAAKSPSRARQQRRDDSWALRSASAVSDPFSLVMTLGVNAMIVVGIVATGIILRNHKPPPKPVTIEAALSALDRGNADEARRLADRLAAKPDISNEEWGTPDYIQGVLAAKAAEPAGGKERTDAFLSAALYLKRARERGFPPSIASCRSGLYLLGKSLCRCGRLDDALPVLEEALRRQPAGHESEIRALLIEALVGAQPPEFEKAMAECDKLLADPQLDDDAKRDVMLQRAEIFVRTDRLKECAAILEKVSENPMLRGDSVAASKRGRHSPKARR